MEITERIETRKDVKAIAVSVVDCMKPDGEVDIITIYGGRFLV